MCWNLWCCRQRRGYARLDTLYRFSAHDNDAERGIAWLVSCGGLDASRRHYRVMYNGGVVFESEFTLNVDNVETGKIVGFIASCRELLGSEVSPQFKTALEKMIAEDPWL